MKLRYLALADLPPLTDIRIHFGHEEVLNRECAIRFVVGVNGTGKTRLLQALTEIFLYLEQGSFPPFPFSLAYDLGVGKDAFTILVQRPKGSLKNAVFAVFRPLPSELDERAWRKLHDWRPGEAKDKQDIGLSKEIAGYLERRPLIGGELPGLGSMASYLPKTIIAYTSGMGESWQMIFMRPPTIDNFEQLPSLDDEGIIDDHPFDPRSTAHFFQEGFADDIEQPINLTTAIGHLVKDNALLPAVSAITLRHLIQEILEGEHTRESLQKEVQKSLQEEALGGGLRGILNEVGWLWPESLHIRFRFEPETWTTNQKRLFCGLFGIASSVIRLPGNDEMRLLSFDFFRPAPSLDDICVGDFRDLFEGGASTGKALYRLLSGESDRPFEMFRHLTHWQDAGIITGMTLTVRKYGIDDVLLYDWLSDGERMFLGRMALFHLLKGQDNALLILDEPETHFNDIWKRRIVDIIDDSLRDDASEVLISTHSSIALTDVFDTEITLLRRTPDADTIAVVRTPIPTFGAMPSEIMREVFGAEETVGQRATEFLDMLLVTASHPDLLEAVWREDDIRSTEHFDELWQAVQQLPHHYENKDRLVRLLEGVRAYTRRIRDKGEITAQDALDALQERLGPGYYQFEFRRRLRALTQRDSNAPSD